MGAVKGGEGVKKTRTRLALLSVFHVDRYRGTYCIYSYVLILRSLRSPLLMDLGGKFCRFLHNVMCWAH